MGKQPWLARMVMCHLPGTAQSSLPPALKPHSLSHNHQGYFFRSQSLPNSFCCLILCPLCSTVHSYLVLHPQGPVYSRNAENKSYPLTSCLLQHHLWVKPLPDSLLPSSDLRSRLLMDHAEIAPGRNLSR